MSSIEAIVSRVRVELRDVPTPFQASIAGDGASSRFELPFDFIDSVGLIITKVSGAGTEVLTTPTDYTLNAKPGVLTLTVPPAVGETLVISGNHFRMFDTSDLTLFANTSFEAHNALKNPVGTIADVGAIEEHAIVMLTIQEALWSLTTEASFDVDISTPDGISIPRGQRFAQLMSMIQLWETKYREWTQEFQIGFGRIMISNLRRVSRATNRLVPVYIAREFDDSATPQRVRPRIDSGALPGDTVTGSGDFSGFY